MKIAIVHSFYRSGPSGENIAVQMQAKALAEAGHEVKVIARSTDDRINQPGYAMTSGLTVATGIGPSPLHEINKFDPDIVHVHNLFPNWGDRWVEKSNHPLVVTIHNFRPLCAAGTLNLKGSRCDLCPTEGSHHAVKNKCYQGSAVRTIPLAIASNEPGKNRLVKRANKLIFLNNSVASLFNRYVPEVLISQVKIVPNFVDDVFDSERIAGTENSNSTWLFLGRLSAEKGILPLVRAWPASERLQIAGSGPQEMSVRAAAMGKQIKILGEVNSDQIPALLAGSKGMLLPSLWLEHGPLTYLEALRAGVPIVAKSGNVAAESIKTHGCGGIFSSFEEIPSLLREVASNRESLGRKARRVYEMEFSKAVWLANIERVYEEARAV